MTQSVHISSKPPNLSATFHCSAEEESDQGSSYSVQTPYGFHLDLDFLKYVEEIESGHSVRRANVNTRRGSRGDRGNQRNLAIGGRTSGWTSTESLSSTTSENCQPVLQSPSKSQPLSPSAAISPGLPTCSKVPPPPPPRNPRVERTLLETSLRLQQEQSQFFSGLASKLPDLSKVHPRGGGSTSDLSSASSQLSTDGRSLQMSPSVQNSLSGGWTRASPQTSGRSTPASASGASSLSPGQLQTVREQMASALRQLREMEERVKGVPALEREVTMLRTEKQRLTVELQKKAQELDATLKLKISTEAVEAEPEKTSIAVGDDIPLETVKVCYRQMLEDTAVQASVDLCHAAVETEPSAVHDEAIQAAAETQDVAIWVVESCLGLQSEAEREIDTLQHTIQIQQESIQILETRSSQVNRDLETLRAEEIQRTSKITFDKETLVKPETANVGLKTEVCSKASVGVGFPDLEYLSLTKHDRGIQTDPVDTSEDRGVALVSTGIQWECLSDIQETEEQIPPAEGPLNSIMKRKDGTADAAGSSAGKKSLKFVGILNGGYESTSSEEDDEDEESSSDESAVGGCSDSSVEEEAPLDDTSDEDVNINDDSDDNITAEQLKQHTDDVKEKFELSSRMREACLIVKKHLNDGSKALKSKEVLSSSHTVQLEWFRVSSAKTAQPTRVSNYLMAFSEVSSVLLEHIINMTDGNGNTALHYSVSHSNFTVVDLLLDTGVCDVDQQNKAGYTAVMLAALSAVKEENDMAAVQKLFRMGSVNAKASQVTCCCDDVINS
ncbi:KN motif and ankyrin repeat domain-containing protein 3 [Triplophysa rosa]|uniref:KN motif and ankyrin repeat domain-containing protein 3 n=1 Tax=Triplophysa rosa TaxID=992332 RepID=A0A9W7T429_TRIRA|nr:KN motif and ankyrin repeat domain-containing protein 3 [Triplophysa rosa]